MGGSQSGTHVLNYVTPVAVSVTDPSYKASTLAISGPAFENLTAGQAVKNMINSGVNNIDYVHGIGSSIAIGQGNQIIDYCVLSATQIVILVEAYGGTTANFYVVVGTLAAGTWTFGTAVSVASINRGSSPRNDWGQNQTSTYGSGAPSMQIFSVSSTAFIVGGFMILSSASNYGTGFYVGTVSSSTITLGTLQTIGGTPTNSNSWQFYGFINTSTDTGIVLQDDSVGTTTDAAVISINESTRTISTSSSTGIGWANSIISRIGLLSSNRFIVWKVGGTSYRVGTLSGSTITWVTGVQSGFTPVGAGTSFCSQLLSANLNNQGIILVTATNSTSLYFFSESAGTITFSPIYTKTTTSISNASLSIFDAQKSQYLVVLNTNGAILISKVCETNTVVAPEILIDGYNIQYNFNQTNNRPLDIFRPFGIGRRQEALISDVSTNVIPFGFDWDEFCGTSSLTVSSGLTALVNNIGKIDTNQSGLIPGSIIYVHADGTLGTGDGILKNTYTYTTGIIAGRAITSTVLYVDPNNI